MGMGEDEEFLCAVDTTPLQDMASQCHELYTAYIEAGFTKRQALWLSAASMSGDVFDIPDDEDDDFDED